MNNPFAPPDLFEARRILAVQPHYDDNDIAAGGALGEAKIRLMANGCLRAEKICAFPATTSS